jgi:CheY-like chemotaxis protein
VRDVRSPRVWQPFSIDASVWLKGPDWQFTSARVQGVCVNSVLIVDDERPIRKLLARWLSAEGYVIHEAADAESAVEILATHTISVTLCDRSMPGRDGEWLVAQIRERFRKVAIVLATGDHSLPPRITLQPGVVGYLVKPFTAAVVLDAVHSAIAWHRVAARVRPGQ